MGIALGELDSGLDLEFPGCQTKAEKYDRLWKFLVSQREAHITGRKSFKRMLKETAETILGQTGWRTLTTS